MKSESAMDHLIGQLTKLPGIGRKSAERLAYTILDWDKEKVSELANALVDAKEHIKFCSICCNYTQTDPCEICANEKRDHSVICVVEQPKDMNALERSRQYRGDYHILHGVISPRDNRGPEALTIDKLLARLDDGVEEVILATNPTVEGEATALYVARLLKPLGVKVTRIAHGIPMGGDLDFFDEATLGMAVENRREID